MVEERDDVQKVRHASNFDPTNRLLISSELQALGRLTVREGYDRAFRIKQASHASVLHADLPKEKWVPVSEVSQNPFLHLEFLSSAIFSPLRTNGI